MPAEIRNRIYVLVLGGQTLHVYRKEELYNEVVLRLCMATATDENIMARLKDPDGQLVFARYVDRHRRCNPHEAIHEWDPKKLKLSLLQTCSQIHSEAALIPFQTMTFAISELKLLKSLVARLSPTQARAVRSISTDDLYPFYSLASVKALQGLRNLCLFCEEDENSFDIAWQRSVLASLQGVPDLTGRAVSFEFAFAGWIKFQRLPLTSVQVAMYLPKSHDKSGKFGPDERNLCDAVAAALETRLLSTWDEDVYRRRLKAGEISRVGIAGQATW